MRGLYTALVTPFTSEGEIDYPSFDGLLEAQLAAGVDGLVPCGTTGESPTLSPEEHKGVIAHTTQKVGGRAKVLAGTGSNSTQEAIELSLHAREVGADACLLVSPYYNKPTQEGLYQHFKAIAEAVAFPCLLYNVPGRTSSRIETETIRRLADIEHILGVKDAVGNIDFTSQTLASLPAGFVSVTGNDSQIYPSMLLGGQGAISVLSNVVPELVRELVDSCFKGELEKARALHFKLWPLANSLILETNPIPVKAAMYLLGKIETAALRLPLTSASKGTVDRLKNDLLDLGLSIKNHE